MCLDQYIYKYIFLLFLCITSSKHPISTSKVLLEKLAEITCTQQPLGSFQKLQTSSVAIIMSAACSSLHNIVQLGVLLFLSLGMLIL